MLDDDSHAEVFVVGDGLDAPYLSAQVFAEEVEIHLPAGGVLVGHGDDGAGESGFAERVTDRLQCGPEAVERVGPARDDEDDGGRRGQ